MGASLEGKTVIVTGAAKGIGEAEARHLAACGARVILTDRLKEGEAVARDIGKNAIFVPHDVGEPDDWTRVFEQAQSHFGPVSGLVNNAGIYVPCPIEDETLDGFKATINVNQAGTFLGIKFAAEHMRANGGGAIVNTSSICGIRGLPGIISYTSVKWAVRGMTKAAAAELGDAKIRVNVILPGFFDTDMIKVNAPGANEQAAKDSVVGRLARPAEIGALCAYLLSDEAAFVTGSEFLIDGGWSL